ncbi:MAG: glucosyltransferase domain-containing protein [Lachnospiraceae bacterium]|nr:glucosyltransferase domain-containing protein [Lachnospiraceae bacterium]
MFLTEQTPGQMLTAAFGKIKKEYRTAFIAAFVIGLLIHFPAMLMDIPNHDGLDSLYFDQNMITSGRWFLTVACGFSSYFTLPWVIGLLGLVFLGLAAAALTALWELSDTVSIVLVCGLLVSFPALASTFAYVFTLDGYMLALLLAVLAVLCTKKWKKGFLAGAVCLAFSMGTYQAYLPFAILLCIYEVLLICMGERGTAAAKAAGDITLSAKIKAVLPYLYMGVLGVACYYGLLQLLLLIQGKELVPYQGMDQMAAGSGFSLATIVGLYRDFASFTLKGNVVFHSGLSLACCAALVLALALALVGQALQRKWWKNPFFFVIMAMTLLVIPPAANVILVISPEVTYHLLMRYQWVLFPMMMTAFVSRCAALVSGGSKQSASMGRLAQWIGCAAAFVLVFHYAVTDNIGYSNLQKRYEKTYAYCVRLLDRIEQTPGYYQGIPIAMVGVVGYNPFPVTDITLPVTSNMIGLNGDTLLYTGENYEVFIRNYLGASLNMMTPEEMQDIYFSEEYIEMESFPAPSSVQVVDGVMYVKTENVGRD